MELAVMIGVYGLMLAVAVLWICGKGGSLLAGYNTMSRKKKAKYNEKALLRFVGCTIIVFVVLNALSHVAAKFGSTRLSYIAFIVAIAILIGAMIYANVGKRFRKQADDTSNI